MSLLTGPLATGEPLPAKDTMRPVPGNPCSCDTHSRVTEVHRVAKFTREKYYVSLRETANLDFSAEGNHILDRQRRIYWISMASAHPMHLPFSEESSRPALVPFDLSFASPVSLLRCIMFARLMPVPSALIGLSLVRRRR